MPSRRGAFVTWMLHHRDRATVEVPAAATPGGRGAHPATECWTISELLFALWDDRTDLPTCMLDGPGIEGATTFGEAARKLAAHRPARPGVGPVGRRG